MLTTRTVNSNGITVPGTGTLAMTAPSVRHGRSMRHSLGAGTISRKLRPNIVQIVDQTQVMVSQVSAVPSLRRASVSTSRMTQTRSRSNLTPPRLITSLVSTPSALDTTGNSRCTTTLPETPGRRIRFPRSMPRAWTQGTPLRPGVVGSPSDAALILVLPTSETRGHRRICTLCPYMTYRGFAGTITQR